ncbi:MAG: phage protein [Anaerocolumna sp.]|nr:phage protein [Anaerocolumna sp.]
MFENMTYETILDQMLGRVTNDVDKREGSIIYDALAPCAYELAQIYFDLNHFVDLVSGDTAVGEYLDRIVTDYGLTRKAATNAIRKITTSGPVAINTRWGINNTVYAITEMVDVNVYKATCEQPGSVGNYYDGKLTNIDNVSGVTAVLGDILIPGNEEENDNTLRERFRQYLANPARNSNTAQYKQWAMEFSGVGRAKIFPLWNGGNTIKIAITDSNYGPASDTLIDAFQDYIDPSASGLGNGAAPIGSKVTVTGGARKNISVTANVVLADGYTEPEGAAKAITEYLAGITYERNTVNYMRVGSTLLECISIVDINNLKINAGTVDVLLSDDEIPVLNNLSLVVVS